MTNLCYSQKNCGRRKRSIESLTTTAIATSGRRVKRSVADILKEFTDSPEMLTKTVGVAIQNADGASPKVTPVVVQSGYADDAKLRSIEEHLKNLIDGALIQALSYSFYANLFIRCSLATNCAERVCRRRQTEEH
jgi:hypothetical protein